MYRVMLQFETTSIVALIHLYAIFIKGVPTFLSRFLSTVETSNPRLHILALKIKYWQKERPLQHRL